jgi:hypothetical protein
MLDKFLMGDIPKPKTEPTYAQAVNLVTEISVMRDNLNRHLVKYWDWKDVRDMGMLQRLNCLMGLALQYSSEEYEDEDASPSLFKGIKSQRYSNNGADDCERSGQPEPSDNGTTACTDTIPF